MVRDHLEKDQIEWNQVELDLEVVDLMEALVEANQV